MNRRRFIGSLASAGAAPAVQLSAASNLDPDLDREFSEFKVLSPPVVQNPTESSFSVSWMVNETATGWVEWGTSETLGTVAKPAHHGLMSMSPYGLSVKVSQLPIDTEIYYRVVTMPIRYHNAYSIERGAPIAGQIRRIRLPRASDEIASLVMVNDTHDHGETIAALAQRVNELDPDAVLWNGDAANTFDDTMQVARICLTPGQLSADLAGGGWASTRPLFFTFGNHDARGQSARILPELLTPWPLGPGDPDGLAPTPYGAGRYCFTKRMGPIGIVCLDTGEDKPDSRDVWGGMAAYEPYREAQRDWLVQALEKPEIAEAPYLLAFCHIPLRGLEGQNDGMGDTGYAGFSGFGQKLWMRLLIDAGCQMVLSGHTHRHRIDEPNDEFPLYQLVGGGPRKEQATLTQIQADHKELRVKVENLEGREVSRVILQPRG